MIDKRDVQAFFDRLAPDWDAGMVRNEAVIARILDNAGVCEGCTVLDVIVDHPIYGQLTGPLQLSTRYDVVQFIARCAQADAQPLSKLTEGIHLHTLSCPSEEAFQRVRTALHAMGVLLED